MKTSTENIDITLWEELKTGNITAFGELYDSYVDILVAHGMYLSNDKEYVMDCIHDLFLDLFKYRSKIAKTNNVKHYLLKSLGRKINRKYKAKTIAIGDEVLENKLKVSPIQSREEEMIALENSFERIFKLKRAINFLTKRQQKGLFLRFNEDRPYEEIAEIMDVSVQTSRTIVYRGIKALRHHLVLIPALIFFL